MAAAFRCTDEFNLIFTTRAPESRTRSSVKSYNYAILPDPYEPLTPREVHAGYRWPFEVRKFTQRTKMREHREDLDV